MERFKVVSEVNLGGLICRHEYIQEFDESENVFGRALIYRKTMQRLFPNADFNVLSAEAVREEGEHDK